MKSCLSLSAHDSTWEGYPSSNDRMPPNLPGCFRVSHAKAVRPALPQHFFVYWEPRHVILFAFTGYTTPGLSYPIPSSAHWTLDDQAEPHTIFSISQRETSVGYLMLPASSNQAYSVFDFSHVFSILPVAFWRTHTLSLARSLSRSLGLYARSVSGFDMQLLPCCVGRSFHTQVGVWQGAVHTHLIFPSSSCARMALC